MPYLNHHNIIFIFITRILGIFIPRDTKVDFGFEQRKLELHPSQVN